MTSQSVQQTGKGGTQTHPFVGCIDLKGIEDDIPPNKVLQVLHRELWYAATNCTRECVDNLCQRIPRDRIPDQGPSTSELWKVFIIPTQEHTYETNSSSVPTRYKILCWSSMWQMYYMVQIPLSTIKQFCTFFSHSLTACDYSKYMWRICIWL